MYPPRRMNFDNPAWRNTPLRKVTIGKVGKLTPEEARKEAEAILAKAELGQDVARDRAKPALEVAPAMPSPRLSPQRTPLFVRACRRWVTDSARPSPSY